MSCVSDIHNQTNQRISDRNLPSNILQPYLDVRPIMTKYSHFPIIDSRLNSSVSLIQAPSFSVEQTFNPGNTKSPWIGFASNVNIESELRNQVYALQKSNKAVYIPSSSSDLYKYNFKVQQDIYNPHELLFKNEQFEHFNPNPVPEICGSGLFYNNTRCQLREIINKKNAE